MTPAEIKDALAELNPDALTADGFDKALIGYVERCGMEPQAVYNEELCLKVLMEQGMDRDSAQEYFDFNVKGAYVGEHTPFFITILV